MAAKKRRNYGQGSVFYRHPANGRPGVWVAQLVVTDPLAGTRRKVTRQAATREAARDLLDKLRDGNAPSARPSGGSLLADYFKAWIADSLPHTGLAPRTQTIYADVLRWYGAPAAGKVTLAGLTPTLGEKWLAKVAATLKNAKESTDDNGVITPAGRHGDPISASTVRNTYVAAVKCLDTAVRDGVIPDNPLRRVARPKVPKSNVPVTSADDCDKLLTACQGRRVEPLAWFIAFTGCRIGEGLNLRWADVDLDVGHAVIRYGSQTRASTKTGNVRTVTLIPEVVAQLRAVKVRTAAERLALGSGWTDTGLVFVSVTGQPLDRRNVTHELQRACRAAGVNPARPWHSLRHGIAHRLLAKGVPLHVVSAILGHSGVGITADLYGHVDSRVPVDVLTEALDRKA